MLNDFALKTHLDFSQHLSYKIINLFEQYVFDSASKFCHVIAANGAYILYALACMVRYDVTKHNKINKHYTQQEQLNWDYNKALWRLTKDLADSEKKLDQSQNKFTNMQKKQDYLLIDLKSTETQVKSLHNQNFVKDLELQCAKTKLNMYNLKYKCDPKAKQQYKKRNCVQENQQNKIIKQEQQKKAELSNKNQDPQSSQEKDVQQVLAAAKASYNE